MRVHIVLPLCLATAGLALAARPVPQGTTFVETFDNASNTGGWTFGNSFESITQDGANRGFHLRNVYLDTFAPQPRTTEESIFSGDYRARGVTSVGVDLRVYRVDYTTRGRNLTVVLGSDLDTPRDSADDCRVYQVGQRLLPPPGHAWIAYDFPVPSGSPVMPEGWGIVPGFCTGLDADSAWNAVIGDVDRLGYYGGDPELFYIFQVWDLGLDNPRITYTAAP
jgi:hypothetical protein